MVKAKEGCGGRSKPPRRRNQCGSPEVFQNQGMPGAPDFSWSWRTARNSVPPHAESGLRGRGGAERRCPRRWVAASLAGNGAGRGGPRSRRPGNGRNGGGGVAGLGRGRRRDGSLGGFEALWLVQATLRGNAFRGEGLSAGSAAAHRLPRLQPPLRRGGEPGMPRHPHRLLHQPESVGLEQAPDPRDGPAAG